LTLIKFVRGNNTMKFTIEMNVQELARSIQVGTLEALVRDVQTYEDEVRVTKAASKVTESEKKVTNIEEK